MLWQEELRIIDELSAKVSNLGSDVSKQLIQFESRRDTLKNEINRLESDYALLQSRNEEARKQFQKSQRLDLEKLQDDQIRVKNREALILEKEKELRKMTEEAQEMLASLRSQGGKNVRK